MSETKETTGVDQKGMSKEREKTVEFGEEKGKNAHRVVMEKYGSNRDKLYEGRYHVRGVIKAENITRDDYVEVYNKKGEIIAEGIFEGMRDDVTGQHADMTPACVVLLRKKRDRFGWTEFDTDNEWIEVKYIDRIIKNKK